MSDIAKELEDLGLTVEFSTETAEAQWKMFAREYRIAGERAEGFAAFKRDLMAAIMCGDAEVIEVPAGVAIKQHVRHPLSNGPSEITYNPPNAATASAGGTDGVALTMKWCRVAAALAMKTDGQLVAWLAGRDYSLMEMIAQLFTTV